MKAKSDENTTMLTTYNGGWFDEDFSTPSHDAS